MYAIMFLALLLGAACWTLEAAAVGHQLLAALCAVPLVLASAIRSFDILFDPIASFSTMNMLVLLVVFSAVALFASSKRPIRVCVVLFILLTGIKCYADLSVSVPVLSCGTDMERPSLCTVLVTGANSGIGFAVSRALVKQGHLVILGCRSASKCDAALVRLGAPHNAMALSGLDLGSLQAVSDYVDTLAASSALAAGGIDLLINNAGLVPVKNQTTADGYEIGWGVSYLGHHALLRWLQGNPKGNLLKTDASVIFTSSIAMRFGAFHDSLLTDPGGEGDLRGEMTTGCESSMPVCVPPPYSSSGSGFVSADMIVKHLRWGSYARSKLANVLHARELARRFPAMHTASVHPGMVNTPMAKSIAPPGLSDLDLGEVLRSWGAWLERVQDHVMWMLLRSPDQAAAILLHAAVRGGRSGGYYNGMGQLCPDEALPSAAVDDVIAKRLWDIAEKKLLTWGRSA